MALHLLHQARLLLAVFLLIAASGCTQLTRLPGDRPGQGQRPGGGKGPGSQGHGGNTTAKPGGVDANAAAATYVNELNLNNSVAPVAVSNKYAANVHYGTSDRLIFDMYLPKGPTPAPLVIFIHGGGFANGSKDHFHKRFAPEITAWTNAGYGVATINYRFLREGPEGVKNSLRDIQRCLQFIRYHAAELGIDKDRIGCMGISAGAGSSVWLGVHDDLADPNNADPIARESTRIQAVAAINPQSSYDIFSWDPLFMEKYGVKPTEDPRFKPRVTEFYGTSDFQALTTDPAFLAMRKDLDMPAMMDRSDPEMWFASDKEVDKPSDVLHNSIHIKRLVDTAQSKGIKVNARIPSLPLNVGTSETLQQFFLRTLK